jgi:hypothetical protein
MEVGDKLKNTSGRRAQGVQFVTGLFVWLLLLFLFIFGCSERHASKRILLEFKQQPGETYIYRIADDVEWEIDNKDGTRYAYHHRQEQKSEMRIEAIDSAAVRSLMMSFLVTKDTTINAPEFAQREKRKPIVGKRFEYQLRMRRNGEIIAVESDDPRVTFFFDRSYKPSQPVFPDRAILPGYVWKQNFQIDVPRGNPTVATTEYRFNGFAKVDQFDCAVIDFKGELEFTESFESSAAKSSGKFVVKKYHTQMTSEGRIFFAYREGFMVKKANLITSTARSTAFTKDKVEEQCQTIFRDRERITLTEIHRPGGEVVRYQIQ